MATPDTPDELTLRMYVGVEFETIIWHVSEAVSPSASVTLNVIFFVPIVGYDDENPVQLVIEDVTFPRVPVHKQLNGPFPPALAPMNFELPIPADWLLGEQFAEAGMSDEDTLTVSESVALAQTPPLPLTVAEIF